MRKCFVAQKFLIIQPEDFERGLLEAGLKVPRGDREPIQRW